MKTQNTSIVRVSNHNNWPVVELFQAEKEFMKKLAELNMQQIFVTANLIPDEKDQKFNTIVGFILDSLDSLPMHPDGAFDSLYKAIDSLIEVSPIEGVSRIQMSVDILFEKNPHYWNAIVTTLTKNMPQQSADYAAARMLECIIGKQNKHTKEMQKRASRSIGKRRFAEFHKKFILLGPIMLPYSNKRKAGQLISKVMRISSPLGSLGASSTSAGTLWDLTLQSNMISSRDKLRVLMEIFVSTYRHERFHGEAFSPFRSSKASLKTYAHAYYMLIVAYIFILGLLENEGRGEIEMQEIYSMSQKVMGNFDIFFTKVIDK